MSSCLITSCSEIQKHKKAEVSFNELENTIGQVRLGVLQSLCLKAKPSHDINL